MADRWDAGMDYHLIACSGARTYNILRDPENGELAQIQQGYLDQNTTVVSISIGGNDSRFTHVIQKCLVPYGSDSCKDKLFDDHEPRIDRDVDGDGYIDTNRDGPYRGLPMEPALPALITDVVKGGHSRRRRRLVRDGARGPAGERTRPGPALRLPTVGRSAASAPPSPRSSPNGDWPAGCRGWPWPTPSRQATADSAIWSNATASPWKRSRTASTVLADPARRGAR
ncbi:hypothetical protein AB0A76_03770 [Streptomyces exfoliatus]|uniref:SGNH hydrolase-type esterase domain-containing protein n=1 Tax=Streptomyces exfoliatus TaxID=1905 RepID=A0ABV3CQ23_STREX